MSWGTKQGNAYDVVYGYGAYGNTPKPASEMTLGEVVDWGKNVLIPATKGQIRDNQGNLVPDKGTSAVGAYQFTQGTLNDVAPKVLGEGWQNQKFSPEVQEGIARYLYEQSKGGNLRSRWQGLKNEQPGYYKDIPWEQARLEILHAESKMPESHTLSSSTPVSSQNLQAKTNPVDLSNNQNLQAKTEHIDLPGNQMGLAYLAQKESELRGLRGKLNVAEADREYYKSITPKAEEGLGLASMQITMPNMVNTNAPVFDARRARKAGNRQVYLG